MNKSTWSILIVDDQTSVVDGLLAGVDWKRLRIEPLYTAFNTFEAQQKLTEHTVDLMLCDIEMPVENGISLLRWIRGNGLATLCIFITAHAKFDYASAALQLGSFDYVLKPFSYRDIESVLQRAMHKLRADQASQHMQTKDDVQLVDDVLRGWFIQNDVMDDTFQQGLERLGVQLQQNAGVYLAWLQLYREKTDTQFPDTQLRKALGEGLRQNFKHYGQNILLTNLSRYSIGCVIYPRDSFAMDQQGVHRQLEKLLGEYSLSQGASAACFFTQALPGQQIRTAISYIEEAIRGSSFQEQKVLFVDSSREREIKISLPDISAWGVALLEMEYDRIAKLATETIYQCAEQNMLSQQWLQRFHLEFMQMIAIVLEQKGISLNDIMQTDAELEMNRQALESVDGLTTFVRFILQKLAQTAAVGSDANSQLQQAIRYIHNHIDTEIRRDDIARAVYLHPNYLSALFRSTFGQTLKDYIIQEKMDLAQQLLSQTRLPVSVIAQRVGYQNFSHFSQTYKRIKGKTPNEERK